MKKALITGLTGQDGSYLAELLLSKGYEVHGLVRRSASYPDNLQYVPKEVIVHFGDLTTEHHLITVIHELQPDELYNLGSQSDVRISFDIPEYTGDATGISVVKLLEAVRLFSKHTKVYQASTSELFGGTPPPQNEMSPLIPNSPYAVAKLYAHHMCRVYREAYGMYIACGILFNHESPRRGKNFVTRKITAGVTAIIKGKQDNIHLGNLDSRRDWGYAKDYAEAMWLMLQQDDPQDFVIGTGHTHTVGEFVELAFSYHNLDWHDYVVIDPAFFRPLEVNYLLSDPKRAEVVLGWRTQTSLEELVNIMMEAES